MKCYKCGESQADKLIELYGYTICNSCKSNLGLFQDKTILRHITANEEARKQDPTILSYEEDMKYRLDFIKKDYISKKIKLLHILDRLPGN